MRKGQAAMEFLMTYGWAILAIIVVIGALSYFTGGYRFFFPSTCTTYSPFYCEEYKASEDGTVTLGIANVAENLNYVNVTILCENDPTQERSYEHTGLIKKNDRINDSVILLGCPPGEGRFRARGTINYRNEGEGAIHQTKIDLKTDREP